MDPVSLATAAVALLSPYLAQAASGLAKRTGETVADAALPSVKELYERLRDRLGQSSYHGALLDGIQEQPENPGRREIVQGELTRILERDQVFKAELEQLVAAAQEAGGIRNAANEAGATAGRDVIQWAGGDIVGRNKIGGDQVGRDKITNASPPTDL